MMQARRVALSNLDQAAVYRRAMAANKFQNNDNGDDDDDAAAQISDSKNLQSQQRRSALGDTGGGAGSRGGVRAEEPRLPRQGQQSDPHPHPQQLRVTQSSRRTRSDEKHNNTNLAKGYDGKELFDRQAAIVLLRGVGAGRVSWKRRGRVLTSRGGRRERGRSGSFSALEIRKGEFFCDEALSACVASLLQPCDAAKAVSRSR